MKIFRFDRETRRSIDHFNSSGFTLTRVAHLLEETMFQYAYLGPNGLIGYHAATVSQLFLVVQGEGWVRGQVPQRTQVQAGQGAYWDEGEGHETETQTGMSAIIIGCSFRCVGMDSIGVTFITLKPSCPFVTFVVKMDL